MATARMRSPRKIAARTVVITGCRYVQAATSELSTWASAQAFSRYAATVGPAITAARAIQARSGIPRQFSWASEAAASGSMSTDAIPNIQVIICLAETRDIIGLERSRESAQHHG